MCNMGMSLCGHHQMNKSGKGLKSPSVTNLDIWQEFKTVGGPTR